MSDYCEVEVRDVVIDGNSKPERDFEGKAMGDRPTKRACLCCGKAFHSDGWHNRLCPTCQRRG